MLRVVVKAVRDVMVDTLAEGETSSAYEEFRVSKKYASG